MPAPETAPDEDVDCNDSDAGGDADEDEDEDDNDDADGDDKASAAVESPNARRPLSTLLRRAATSPRVSSTSRSSAAMSDCWRTCVQIQSRRTKKAIKETILISRVGVNRKRVGPKSIRTHSRCDTNKDK